MSDGWLSLLRGGALDPDDAATAAEVLAPAVRRLAWEGEDPDGDRRRALRWLRAAVAALADGRTALSAVVDWWLVAALDEEPVQLAWSIDREVPAPTGEALREILGNSGQRRLEEVRRPVLFQQVLEALAVAADRNPGKIAADKAILGPVLADCKTVIRHAREGRPPPTDLALATATQADIEGWASSERGGRHVIPGTPVYNTLIRHITERADLVRRALRLWPTDRDPPVALPASWRRDLEKVTGDQSELAIALVADALPDPGEHPILAPERALEWLDDAEGPAFFLAREAAAAAGVKLPRWARRIEERLEAVGRELELRSHYEAAAASALDEARSQLERLDFDGAAEWVRAADEEHEHVTAGADLDRRRSLARERAAQLAAAGVDPPAEGPDLLAWATAVDQLWSRTRADLQERADRAVAQSDLLTWTDDLAAAQGRVRQALARAELGPLAEAVSALEDRVGDHRGDEDRRLGPELASIRDRVGRLPAGPVRAGLAEALGRASSRREAGLPWTSLAADLGALADLLARDEDDPAAVALDRGSGARARRVAWALGGVGAAGDEPRPARVQLQLSGVSVTAGFPPDAAKRVSAWGAVHATPPARAEGRVYLAEGGAVMGPYLVVGERLRPEHASVAVAAVEAERFDRLFGRIEVGPGRWLVPQPPSLDELVQVGGAVRDLLDPEAAGEALAERLGGAVAPDVVAKWIGGLESGGLPEAVRQARLARLGALLGEARALEHHREKAVSGWLASPAGQEAIGRAAEAQVEREAERIGREVARRRQELDAELASVKAELDSARRRAEEQEAELAARVEAVRAEAAAVEEVLADKKLRLLVELTGGRSAAAPAPEPTARPSASPIRAARFDPTPLPDVRALVRAVAGKTWPPEDVANLVLSIATGRWTLLAGLPGVGKSTFVRSVLSRLGHGPGTERYLELVVRRDWQDDAALFGFWHPTDRVWTPSSEGFVEHLLRAADDERQRLDGLWPVLVEELNLASPEYYLARPISAFEAADPTVRLYDPELAPANRDRYPPSFRVPDSVRLLATVNVDDTVERLSPRFLSRASVVWVEPVPDAPLWDPAEDVTPHRVRWSDLRALVDPGRSPGSGPGLGGSDLGRIDEVVRFLQAARVPGAPTARTRVAIGRYLAASRGVLEREVAEDLQVLQRVLPPLRGVGPAWRTLLDRLVELLERSGWARSAARTAELRVRGEALGDWYDFFHT